MWRQTWGPVAHTLRPHVHAHDLKRGGELNSKVDIHDDFFHHVHIICQLVALQTSASLHQRQSLSDCAQWSGWVQSSLEGSCSKIYYYLDDDFEREYILYIRLMGSNSG